MNADVDVDQIATSRASNLQSIFERNTHSHRQPMLAHAMNCFARIFLSSSTGVGVGCRVRSRIGEVEEKLNDQHATRDR
jgi:hypothetical protein